MNAMVQDKRLKIALLSAVVVCFIFFPSVFFYGVFGFLTLAFAVGALLYLSAVFRSPASTELCWGRGNRIPMSRRSRFLVGWLLGLVAAYFVVRVLVKPPDTHYLFASVIALMALVCASRWLDKRRE